MHLTYSMMKSNLDRFSRPLDSERVPPCLDAIHEQRELNKKHMVMDYLSDYWNEYSLVPDAEQVQEALYKIDIDLNIIEQEISRF